MIPIAASQGIIGIHALVEYQGTSHNHPIPLSLPTTFPLPPFTTLTRPTSPLPGTPLCAIKQTFNEVSLSLSYQQHLSPSLSPSLSPDFHSLILTHSVTNQVVLEAKFWWPVVSVDKEDTNKNKNQEEKKAAIRAPILKVVVVPVAENLPPSPPTTDTTTNTNTFKYVCHSTKSPSHYGSWPYAFESIAIWDTVDKCMMVVWNKNKSSYEIDAINKMNQHRGELRALKQLFVDETVRAIKIRRHEVGGDEEGGITVGGTSLAFHGIYTSTNGEGDGSVMAAWHLLSSLLLQQEKEEEEEASTSSLKKMLHIARSSINYRLFEEEEASSAVAVLLLQSKPSLAIPTHLLATLAQLEVIKDKLGMEALLEIYQSGGGVGGWGVGEYGALVFGGVLTLKDALVLAACHGKAIEDGREEEEKKMKKRTTVALTTTIIAEENTTTGDGDDGGNEEVEEELVPRVSLLSNIITEEDKRNNGGTSISTAVIAQSVSKAVSEVLQGMCLNAPRLPIVSGAAARRYVSLQDIRDTLPEAVSLENCGGGGEEEAEERRRLMSVLMVEGSGKILEVGFS